jgi:hypothetical protein
MIAAFAFSPLILCLTCTYLLLSEAQHHLHTAVHSHSHYNLTFLHELEKLAESYYFEQLDERVVNVPLDFYRIQANYPCLAGTFPVGGADHDGIVDGHKFVCGPHAIRGAPIVYSYGSHRDQAFELAFLKLRPDAVIHLFEISPDQLPALRDPRINYHSEGLGGYDGVKETRDGTILRTMIDTMKLLNHTYVDVSLTLCEICSFWLRNSLSCC